MKKILILLFLSLTPLRADWISFTQKGTGGQVREKLVEIVPGSLLAVASGTAGITYFTPSAEFAFSGSTFSLSGTQSANHAWSGLNNFTGTFQINGVALGSAAFVGTGTGASQVPLNSQLGPLAYQSGVFSGSSSGVNTGDQTISLTGDVSGSGSGSITATVVASSTSTAGKIAIATAAESQAGSDASKAIVPSVLASWWTWIKTQAQTIAGTWTFSGTAVANTLHLNNGSTAGALRIGADVTATTFTASNRKLAVILSPRYGSASESYEWLATDTGAGPNLAIAYLGGRTGGSGRAAQRIHLSVTGSETGTGAAQKAGVDSGGFFVGPDASPMYLTPSGAGSVTLAGTGTAMIHSAGAVSGNYAFGGQITLPNQTASTADSAMTRGLSDARHLREQIIDLSGNTVTTNNSTDLVNTPLALPLEANARYAIEAVISFSNASNTSGNKVALSYSGSKAATVTEWVSYVNNVGTVSTYSTVATFGGTYSYGGTQEANGTMVIRSGLSTTSSGTLYVMHAQQSATPSNNALRTGSWIKTIKTN